MQENKEYITPELVVFGNVEELTEGPRGGTFDCLFGGDGGFLGVGPGCSTNGSGS